MGQKRTGRHKLASGLGTKTILTDELIEKIAAAMRIGSYPEVACRLNGVDRSSYMRWLKEANTNPDRYPQCVKFRDAIQTAVAYSEIRDLSTVNRYASGAPAEYLKDASGQYVLDANGKPIMTKAEIPADPKWAAWKLSHRSHKRWGRKQAMELSNPDGNMKGTNVVILMGDNGMTAPQPTAEDFEDEEDL